MRSKEVTGIQFALITALISGFSNFLNKYALMAVKPPIVFTSAKNLLVGFLIIAILILARKLPKLKKLTKRELVYLILIGVIGGSIPFYLFFTGLSQIPAINASLIHKTLVVWVAILAIPVLKEKLNRIQMTGVLLLFGSNVFIGGFKGFQFTNGEIMVLSATIFWAIENILAKKILPSVDPDILVGARMGFGSLILVVASLIVAPKAMLSLTSPTPDQAFWLILTAVLLLGYVMSWYRALKFASAITVTSVLVVATVVTNILSAIFVTHALTMTVLIQSGIMVTGVWMLYWSANMASKNVSPKIAQEFNS